MAHKIRMALAAVAMLFISQASSQTMRPIVPPPNPTSGNSSSTDSSSIARPSVPPMPMPQPQPLPTSPGPLSSPVPRPDLPICTTYRDRPEIHDMSPVQVDALIEGIKVLARTKTNGVSVWQQFTNDHNTYANDNHGASKFLPYHRKFLLELENALRLHVNPNMVLPYFNWYVPIPF